MAAFPAAFSPSEPVSEALSASLVELEAPPVSAGPSQCQWSLWGSHPTDSVGLGIVGVAVLS